MNQLTLQHLQTAITSIGQLTSNQNEPASPHVETALLGIMRLVQQPPPVLQRKPTKPAPTGGTPQPTGGSWYTNSKKQSPEDVADQMGEPEQSSE